jgi:hypothetical protein
MTEKLYVGNPVDCNTVRSALDFAMDFPAPGTVNGVPIVNEETRLQMVAAWWAMTPAARDAIIASPVAPWVGWTLQWSELIQEANPGTRHACWIPSDMAAVIQAASAAGRTLTIAQTLALNAAALVGLVSHPANWNFPSPD